MCRGGENLHTDERERGMKRERERQTGDKKRRGEGRHGQTIKRE